MPVLDAARQIRGVVSKSDLLFKEADPTASENLHLLMPSRRREQRKAGAPRAAALMTAPPPRSRRLHTACGGTRWAGFP